jgi:hypothetical protein
MFLNFLKLEVVLSKLQEIYGGFKDIETKELTVIPVTKLFLSFFAITVIPVAYFDKTFLYLEIFIIL